MLKRVRALYLIGTRLNGYTCQEVESKVKSAGGRVCCMAGSPCLLSCLLVTCRLWLGVCVLTALVCLGPRCAIAAANTANLGSKTHASNRCDRQLHASTEDEERTAVNDKQTTHSVTLPAAIVCRNRPKIATNLLNTADRSRTGCSSHTRGTCASAAAATPSHQRIGCKHR